MESTVTLKTFELRTGVRFCVNHTGKMKGMWSLSTSPVLNQYCRKRALNPDSVCSHCYSMRMNRMYKGLNAVLARNSELLKKPLEFLPKIEVPYLRFESFGDLAGITQFDNYARIARANPDVKCALWTKNPGVINQWVIRNGESSIPENLVIVLSSTGLNKPAKSAYTFISKVFTVYDKTSDAEINCGARSCLKCHRCYERGGETLINERLK